MSLTIAADLPLGTYRGAASDGLPETMPSVSRLYSALLCAAGFGPRAQPLEGGGLGICDEDVFALRWLEENPPDAVSIPALVVNRGQATAYREDGTITKGKGGAGKALAFNKPAKSPDTSVAVAGAFKWTWTEDPPATVIAALQGLCPDVPYLGTTQSPVRLQVHQDAAGQDSSTHRLDSNADLFSGAVGHDVELPVSGRLQELRDAHALTQQEPKAEKDKYKNSEASWSPVPPRAAVALARYASVDAPTAAVPWPRVFLVPLIAVVSDTRGIVGDERVVVPVKERVRLAVSVHRALIRVLKADAPPLVTGSYPAPMTPPANRLAVQVLDDRMPVDLQGAAAAVALMLPKDATPDEVGQIATAVESLTTVYGRGGRRYVTGPVRLESGLQFWQSKPPDTVRLWRTVPAAVPESRGAGEGPWTFAHAALLSVGHVWRDQLPMPAGRADERRRAIVAEVNAKGAAVVSAKPLRDSDVRPYVHKVHRHAVIRPYQAKLSLGDLAPDRTIQAIGQSRHLGGGLLVPVDHPVGHEVMR